MSDVTDRTILIEFIEAIAQGKPLGDALRSFSDHDDNTGMRCRVDLNDHDCCYMCNAAQEVLRAHAKCFLLQEALDEAIGNWEGWNNQEYTGTSMHGREAARIAELRKLVPSR